MGLACLITFHLCFNLIKEVRLIINNSLQGHYNADLAFEPRSIRRQRSFSQPEAYTASHERTFYALFFSSVKTYLPRVPNHSLVSTVLTPTSGHDSNCHLTSPSPWSQVLDDREPKISVRGETKEVRQPNFLPQVFYGLQHAARQPMKAKYPHRVAEKESGDWGGLLSWNLLGRIQEKTESA